MVPYDRIDTIFLDVGNTLISIDFDWIAAELCARGFACEGAAVRRAEAASRPGYSQRLFVDGVDIGEEWRFLKLSIDVTIRRPRLHAFGNWLMGLQELLIREPTADLYAMFQDDLLVCKGLRGYVEKSVKDRQCYWNLFTTCISRGDAMSSWNGIGWNPSARPGTSASRPRPASLA